MRSRSRLVLGVASAVLVLGLGSSPAFASRTAVCVVGAAIADHSPGTLGLPVLTSDTVTGTVSGGTQVCSDLGAPLTASYTVTGACGKSSGTASASGHSGSIETVGTLMVIIPPLSGAGLSGVGNAVVDSSHAVLVHANSCVDKTAHQFLVSGVFALATV